MLSFKKSLVVSGVVAVFGLASVIRTKAASGADPDGIIVVKGVIVLGGTSVEAKGFRKNGSRWDIIPKRARGVSNFPNSIAFPPNLWRTGESADGILQVMATARETRIRILPGGQISTIEMTFKPAPRRPVIQVAIGDLRVADPFHSGATIALSRIQGGELGEPVVSFLDGSYRRKNRQPQAGVTLSDIIREEIGGNSSCRDLVPRLRR